MLMLELLVLKILLLKKTMHSNYERKLGPFWQGWQKQKALF